MIDEEVLLPRRKKWRLRITRERVLSSLRKMQQSVENSLRSLKNKDGLCSPCFFLWPGANHGLVDNTSEIYWWTIGFLYKSKRLTSLQTFSSSEIFIWVAESENIILLKRSDSSHPALDACELTEASSERWLSRSHCQLRLIFTFSVYVTVPVIQLTPNHVTLSFLCMDQEEMSWK